MNEHLKHQLLMHHTSKLSLRTKLMFAWLASWNAIPMLWNSNRPFRLHNYLYLRYMLRAYLISMAVNEAMWNEQARLIDAYYSAEADLARLRAECNAKVAIFKNQPLKETFHA